MTNTKGQRLPQTSLLPSKLNLSSTTTTTTPDFTTIIASKRFFISSPGRSNSITESAAISSPESMITNSRAISTYSPDPYNDFRRSMREMVKSRGLVDVKSTWDYLHELLLCYLNLNPKSNHKFVFSAFADLLLSLSPASEGGRREY